jgi:hypothetical protein
VDDAFCVPADGGGADGGQGAARADALARPILAEVYDRIGFLKPIA